METTIYTIDGKDYKMLTLDILGVPTNVASYDLNKKIEEIIINGGVIGTMETILQC